VEIKYVLILFIKFDAVKIIKIILIQKQIKRKNKIFSNSIIIAF